MLYFDSAKDLGELKFFENFSGIWTVCVKAELIPERGLANSLNQID